MTTEELLRSISNVWERQITLCDKAKQRDFGNTAQQLWSFLGKGYRDLYLEVSGGDPQHFSDAKGPWYKARINKSAEFADLMTAHVLSQVPHRKVSPRRPAMGEKILRLVPDAADYRQLVDANDVLASYLMEWWLNYTSTETKLKREATTALPEAFVKGRGILWHELVPAPIGEIPASRFVSVDDLLVDADARRLHEAGFIIRRRLRSTWLVSEERGISREKLRGLARQTSTIQQASNGKDTETSREPHDVVEYFEVYSQLGLGHWLDSNEKVLEPLSEALDELGHHCYLEILPGLQYPMNLPPEVLVGEEGTTELKRRIQWPIRFYADMASNPWPMSVLDLKPGQQIPWPRSPMEPGLPMQIFLDHLYCFIMSRIRVSSRNLLIVSHEIEQEVRQAIKQGFDLEVVGTSGRPGEEIDRLIKAFEFPQLNSDLWQVVVLVERAFERATGLEPLLYGAEGQRQIRSAKEADIRQAHASSRPDDYADAVEDWLSEAGAKEGMATRMHVGGETVAPLFAEPVPESEDSPLGPMTAKWNELITTDDEYQAASEFVYTVAAGEARRRNKGKQTDDFQQITQTLGQLLGNLGMAGVPGPFNALVDMLGETMERPLDGLKIPEGLQVAPEQIRAESEEAKAKIQARQAKEKS